MASLAGQMPDIDAEIFAAIGETLAIGTNDHKGIFYNQHRVIELRDGSIAALDISFDCQITDAIKSLAENEQVTVEGHGFRFIRRLPDQGDESGKVTLELGKVSA